MKILPKRAGKAPIVAAGRKWPAGPPAVTGNEVRTSQVRIQVEPRIIVFIRPEP